MPEKTEIQYGISGDLHLYKNQNMNLQILNPIGALMLLISCQSPETPNDMEITALRKEVQLMQSELKKLKQTQSRDSFTAETTAGQPAVQKVLSGKKTESKPASPPIPKKEKALPVAEKYFYQGGSQLSASFSPWTPEGERTVQLFDPKGHETFVQHDARKSYHIISRIASFHSNGAVQVLEIRTNPGASMYMYQTTITFDINNEPLWKTETTEPQQSLEHPAKGKFYWSKKEKRWIEQEYIREDPVPVEFR